MTKSEFIDGLRTALTGELPDSEITSNIRFYEDYIKSKSIGTSEEVILAQLGDPRLIAKTIIETYQISHGPLYSGSKHEKAYQDAQTTDGSSYQDYKSKYDNNSNDYGKGFKFNLSTSLTWYQKVILIVIAVILIVLFFIIGGILLQLFFTVGLPLLIVYLGYRLIVNNNRR
ncbi:DUF1700 domain-containing protein [Anaerocolumna sedimenticola]|uniref:DUF1700 domain-containing protein n=1 Tax=Anaerocolumna sedimenticola TaxID=2696063 RepID=A0A6P1TJ23_9FIRM|nr:DUF1700 domain-containing protein [Anaerocolumna sedimenticola]QHQ59916.1 DUF1700 domain-containing protein [Anaerocolumna sedimenticola]